VLEAETDREDPKPILKQGEEVRSYGSHLLGRMHHIPSQKAHSMKVRRKPPHFPFPDRLSSVFFALGGKVISEHSSRIRSTSQLLGDGDCALAIDGDGEQFAILPKDGQCENRIDCDRRNTTVRVGA
jgi:hypothetical protein